MSQQFLLRSVVLLSALLMVACGVSDTNAPPTPALLIPTSLVASPVAVTPAPPLTNTVIIHAMTVAPLPSPVLFGAPGPTEVPPTSLAASCRGQSHTRVYCSESFDRQYLAVIRQPDYTHATADLVDMRTSVVTQIGRGYAIDVVWSPTAELMLVNEYRDVAQRTFILDATTLMTTELPITAYSTATNPYHIDGRVVNDGTWSPGGLWTLAGLGYRSDMTWSPDGKHIALLSGGLYVADADGSHLRPVPLVLDHTLPGSDNVEWMGIGGPPYWSRDGQYVSICDYFRLVTPLSPSSMVPPCRPLRVAISSGETTLVLTPTP
jgi:hypothetical protein